MIPLIPVIGMVAAGWVLNNLFSDKPDPVVVTKTRYVKRGPRGIKLPTFFANDTIPGWVRRNRSWLAANNINNPVAAAWVAKRGKKWFF